MIASWKDAAFVMVEWLIIFFFFLLKVTKDMGSVVKGLDKALQSMDLQKVSEVQTLIWQQYCKVTAITLHVIQKWMLSI